MLEVNYEYYTDTYGGSSIPSNSFKRVSNIAISKVNSYTFNRLNSENITNDVKDTVCEIAELIYKNETLREKMTNTEEKIISSESVGPHSITYENKSNNIESQTYGDEELEKVSYSICYRRLVHTGLMYRGF